MDTKHGCAVLPRSQRHVGDQYQEGWQERAAWIKVRNAERDYARKLRRLVSMLHEMVQVVGPDNLETLEFAINRYIDAITPWAESVARRLVMEVTRRDSKAWATFTRGMGRSLRQQIEEAPVGRVLQTEIDRQMQLIRSIPQNILDAVREAFYEGMRPRELSLRLQELGVSDRNRATLIARTETSRIASTLTMVRAQHIGSEEYIWRSMRDARVRPALNLSAATFARLDTLEMGSHRKLEGTTHRWDNPPIAMPNGTRAHPGTVPNCRCFAEPIIPERFR